MSKKIIIYLNATEPNPGLSNIDAGSESASLCRSDMDRVSG